MKKPVLFLTGGFSLVLLVLLVFSTDAMDWPSEEAEMVHNFGWNYEGRPLLGASFEVQGPVRAAEEGDILFTHFSGSGPDRFPSPLGAWMALDHGDGLISIYSRLEDAQEITLEDRVIRGRVIAAAGQSGWSNQWGFYFSFFDRKERRWINPSRLSVALPDTALPSISSVELKNADGQLINPAQGRISQGRYTIRVNAADFIKDEPHPLAPYQISCFVNGVEAGALVFEAYSARNGVMMVYRNGLVPVKQVYAPVSAYEVGEVWFTRGQATLEVVAADINANSRSVSFKLQVE
jgi:hypothetical protein